METIPMQFLPPLYRARAALLPALVVISAWGNANADTPPKPVTLDSVVVKGQAMSASPDQPYSVQSFSQEDIRERQLTHVEKLYREVPGMEVRDLQYGSVANSITLRGFGGGGHGGDIGFVIDGIPLNEAASHADGYADLGVLIPLEIGSMTIYRGPVSALYGNFNRAGAIVLESRKGGSYLESDLKYGSFNTLDAQIAAGGKLGVGNANGAAQIVSSDGFRPGTTSHRATLAGRVSFDLSKQTQLAISSRLHSARADTASVITKAQYDGTVRGFYERDPNVQNDGTDKGFFTLRGDLSHTLNENLRVLGFAYSTQQTFTRYFTRITGAGPAWNQRMEDYDRGVTGFGASLNGQTTLAGSRLNWVAGAERYSEQTKFRYADFLNNRNFTAATVAAGGSGTQNRKLTINSTALFAQGEWALSPYFRPSLGLRSDRIDGNCRVMGAESVTGGSAQCNNMPAMSRTSPKIGVRSTLLPRVVEARASHSEGFQIPNTSSGQAYTAGLSAGPTTFAQNEIGLTLTPHPAWFVDVAAYVIKSSGEIQEVPAGSLNFINVGSTRRAGTEAEIRFTPADWIDLTAALSSTSSRIENSATAASIGQPVTGVPKSMSTLSATFRPHADTTISLIHRDVGRYPLNTPATIYYDGYRTLDLMASYQTTRAGSRNRFYVQITNLTDRKYATSAGISSGTQTYNIAPPRTVTIGATLDF
jgi:outer membrane receptor protein involved in Fe transport